MDLDSVATLIPFGGWDLQSVNMVLQTNVPIHIENPEPGRRYTVGDVQIHGGIGVRVMGGWTTTGESKQFMFSTTNTAHTVETPVGRKYRAELTSTTDKSVPRRKAIEYAFSITEQ